LIDIFARLRFLQGKVNWGRISKIAALISLIAFIAVLTRYFADVETLRKFLPYGYLGAFLVSFITNLTIIFPVPGELAMMGAAAVYSPLWIGVVWSVGAVLGETSSYLVGFWGQAVIKQKYSKRYERAEAWLKRYGALTLFIFALSPFLIFDLVGIIAGGLKYPFWKFLLACWVGRLIRSIGWSYLGWSSYQLLESWFPWLF